MKNLDLYFSMKVRSWLIKGVAATAMLFSGHIFAIQLSILTEHLAPFQIVTPKAIGGISTEIIEATLSESGYQYSIEAYPWTSSYHRAKHEKNTCIYSLARIPERELLFKWVGHITTSTISFYALKNNELMVNSLEDAKKYKIAVIKDDVTHHFLLSNGFVEGENFYVMNNYDALLQLLEMPSRQIDLVIINDDLINSRVKNKAEVSKYKSVHMLKGLSLDFYFACSLNTEQDIVNKLTNVMKKLEQQGVYSIIRKKWKKSMVNLLLCKDNKVCS